jgi:hypothetical protein
LWNCSIVLTLSKFSNILYEECFLKRNRLLSSLDSKNQIQSFLFFLLISLYLFPYLKKLIYYCRCTTWFKNLRRKDFLLTKCQPKREIEQPRKTSLVESNWLHCTILQINLLLHNTSCILFLVDCIINCASLSFTFLVCMASCDICKVLNIFTMSLCFFVIEVPTKYLGFVLDRVSRKLRGQNTWIMYYLFD